MFKYLWSLGLYDKLQRYSSFEISIFECLINFYILVYNIFFVSIKTKVLEITYKVHLTAQESRPWTLSATVSGFLVLGLSSENWVKIQAVEETHAQELDDPGTPWAFETISNVAGYHTSFVGPLMSLKEFTHVCHQKHGFDIIY